MVSFIVWLFMNPPQFTPTEEKSLEDQAPGPCLKHFIGAVVAGEQGLNWDKQEARKCRMVACSIHFMPLLTH